MPSYYHLNTWSGGLWNEEGGGGGGQRMPELLIDRHQPSIVVVIAITFREE